MVADLNSQIYALIRGEEMEHTLKAFEWCDSSWKGNTHIITFHINVGISEEQEKCFYVYISI